MIYTAILVMPHVLIALAPYSYGLCSYGLHSNGLYSYGLYVLIADKMQYLGVGIGSVNMLEFYE